jgi:Putative Actinobacterial Holin-X, holin superfamily III
MDARAGWETRMGTEDTEDGGRRDAPFTDLIRSLIGDVAVLARLEAELAGIELKQKASKIGLAAGLLAGGGVIALLGIATLVAAAVLALAIVLPAWAAALIVGVVILVVAAVLAMVGRARLRTAAPLAPTRTIETVQEDMRWIRRKTEQRKTLE